MKLRMTVVALSLAGVFLSLYLFLWKRGVIGVLACGSGSCETVQLSSYSRFLGIEVTLIGLGGYLALLGSGLLSLQRPSVRHWPTLTAGLAAGGMLFTIYLTYVELFVLQALCRWCLGSAVLITLILVAALVDWRHTRAAS